MPQTTTILMCPPDFYDIEYEINPWMHKELNVDRVLAMKQWEALKACVESCGAKVKIIKPEKGWPDMVFTANAALLYKNKAYLSDFKYKERKGEVKHFKKWFKNAGYKIVESAKESPNFEGAGDALFLNEKLLFAGYGFRTDASAYDTIAGMGDFVVELCELVDPNFYHIDTCFCPLNEKQAIWWPGAFTSESQATMSKSAELFAVPEEDANHFACNAIVMGKHVIMPEHCDKTKQMLEGLGFTIHQVDMSEYLKAGGACKCLTLVL
jgi:N-dimethylarginine dimethylaminohydrolase